MFFIAMLLGALIEFIVLCIIAFISLKIKSKKEVKKWVLY